MKAPVIAFASIVGLMLSTGCASRPITIAPVGPAAAGRTAADVPAQGRGEGDLQVFSATQKSVPAASDDKMLFDLHTGYDIYDGTGKNIKFVPNHTSNSDEWPDRVALPAGQYFILAQSTWCGWVRMPVVIQGGKTTTVHLDDNWFPAADIPADRLVFLPDGEAVGWSGQISSVSR